MLAPPVPPAPAAAETPLVWLSQPSPSDIILSLAHHARGNDQPHSASMTCVVRSDGRLDECAPILQPGDASGYEDALRHLRPLYRLDLNRSPRSQVTLRVNFPKLYDRAPEFATRPAKIAAVPTDLKPGALAFRCTARADGRIDQCSVDPDVPHDLRLEAPVIAAVEAATVKPALFSDRPIDAPFFFFYDQTPHQMTPARWLQRPSAAALMAAWPRAALAAGKSGSAKIKCRVTLATTLVGCSVIEEDPPGFGFGAAALMLSSSFALQPRKIDGKPEGDGDIIVPIRWSGDRPLSAAHYTVMHVISDPRWTEVPTQADMLGAWPKKLRQSGTPARATLQCSISAQGRPKDCVTELEAPLSSGVDGVALSLLPRFHLNIADVAPGELSSLRVKINFEFSDRLNVAQDRYANSAGWYRALTPDEINAAFPPEALAASVLSGTALVDCKIV